MVVVPKKIIAPYEINPGRRINGKSERYWFNLLKRETLRICAGKETFIDKLKAIHDAIKLKEFGGSLKIEYNPEEKAYRGIEVFANRKGDCDEISYLYVMMSRIINVPSFVSEAEKTTLKVVDVVIDKENISVPHVCTSVFIKRKTPPKGAYKNFLNDKKFRKETLAKLKMKDDPNLHMVLVDFTYPNGFGIQHKKVKVLDRKESIANHLIEVGAVQAGKRNWSAISWYKKALRINPKDARAYHNLAAFFNRKDKNAEALRHITKAIKLGISNHKSHSLAGDILSKMKRFKGAVKQFSLAVSMMREEKKRRLSVLRKLKFYRKKDLKSAFKIWGNWLLMGSRKLAKYYSKLGDAYTKQGNIDKAIDTYKSAVSEHNEFESVVAIYNVAFFIAGKWSGPKFLLKQAQEMRDDLAHLHSDLGWAYSIKMNKLEAMGRPEQANKARKAAIKEYRAVIDMAHYNAHAEDQLDKLSKKTITRKKVIVRR